MNINNMFGVHEQILSFRAKRSEVIASNLANADTPGFLAKDLDFKAAMESLDPKQYSTNLTQTHKGHINDGIDNLEGITKYRIPAQPSLDGNTVDTQIENSQFAENAIRYLASVRFIDGKVKGLLTAIRGD